MPKLEAMQRHRDHAEGFELTLAAWRLESIKAVVRFLDTCPRPAPAVLAPAGERAKAGGSHPGRECREQGQPAGRSGLPGDPA